VKRRVHVGSERFKSAAASRCFFEGVYTGDKPQRRAEDILLSRFAECEQGVMCHLQSAQARLVASPCRTRPESLSAYLRLRANHMRDSPCSPSQSPLYSSPVRPQMRDTV
jgi:hypothetical protein